MAFSGLLFGPALGIAKPLVGDYQFPSTVSVCGSGTPSNNTAMVSTLPFRVSETTTYDRLAWQLATAQTGAALMAGMYDWHGGRPIGASLIKDMGALDLTAGTGTIVVGSVDITFTLNPGTYWLAVWLKDSTLSPVGFATNNAGIVGAIPTDSGFALGTAPPRSLRVTGAYPANMPSTLPSGFVAFSGSVPVVQLRVSA